MDLTLQIPLQSGSMSLLWSEAINSLYNSLLEVLLGIRVHVLNKMSAYLYTNICLQLGCKTAHCPLQCNLYDSSQRRFSQGPAPCLTLQLSALKVSLTLKNKQTDGVKWENSRGELLRVVQQGHGRWASLRYIQRVLQSVPFTRAHTDYPKQKLLITLIVLSRWWLELKQRSGQMLAIITERADKTRGTRCRPGAGTGGASISEQARSTGRQKVDALL